jgi:diamine N-acetyltransferase
LIYLILIQNNRAGVGIVIHGLENRKQNIGSEARAVNTVCFSQPYFTSIVCKILATENEASKALLLNLASQCIGIKKIESS